MQTQNKIVQPKQKLNKSLANSNLIEQLYDTGVVQFGEFTLKSGITAPIYLDLRRVISYPNLLRTIAEKMSVIVNSCTTDSLCGVPYAGIPFATSVALLSNKPMIMPRKETKKYGAKRAIEGVYTQGQTTLIIEDIMTTGSSIKETYDTLSNEGLTVTDVIVFCDRRTSKQNKQKPYTIHALYTLDEIVDYLYSQGKINAHTYQSVTKFINT